jgi:molybdopterin synthase sulfur carrier subunit
MIKILLFAELQEEAGVDNVEVEKAGLTVAEIKEWLLQEYKLSSLANIMVAINESYATEEDEVKDGDTVAFIPPVSGG